MKDAVVGDREERSAERIEERRPRRPGMSGGLLRRHLFVRAQSAADALLVPARQIVSLRDATKQRADIGIAPSVHEHRIVGVPDLLPPRVEDGLLECVVRVERGDDATDRVIN